MKTDQKSNSPTPRCDALEKEICEFFSDPNPTNDLEEWMASVPTGHPIALARQLETELNEALKNVHELNSFDAPIELQKARAELAEWRACATALSKCVSGVCDEDIVALDRFNELSKGK